MFNNDGSQFNNGSDGAGPSIGLEFKLALPPNKTDTPQLLEHLEDTSDLIYADSQGAYTFLPSPENPTAQFIGYGQIPVMREYGLATDGSDLRWQARFGADNLVDSYRAFKSIWHARPKSSPKLLVANGTAYVSWNGATDVESWEVSEGSSMDSLSVVGYAAYAGFETAFNSTATCVQVGAVGDCERKSSEVVCS